ncbi:hypothetical protein Tco_0382963 [Tanacetum coccineum]
MPGFAICPTTMSDATWPTSVTRGGGCPITTCHVAVLTAHHVYVAANDCMRLQRWQVGWPIGESHMYTVTRLQSWQTPDPRNANLLALVAAAQHYLEYHNQAPKPHKSIAPSSRKITSSKSHTTTRSKGKEAVKLVTPPFESASDKDSDEE